MTIGRNRTAEEAKYFKLTDSISETINSFIKQHATVSADEVLAALGAVTMSVALSVGRDPVAEFDRSKKTAQLMAILEDQS